SSASPHTTAFSTLSLHDALPISNRCGPDKLLWQSLFHLRLLHSDTPRDDSEKRHPRSPASTVPAYFPGSRNPGASRPKQQPPHRSEEHTSELQSLRHLVCRLLLE